MNKVVANADEAIEGMTDNMTLMVGLRIVFQQWSRKA